MVVVAAAAAAAAVGDGVGPAVRIVECVAPTDAVAGLGRRRAVCVADTAPVHSNWDAKTKNDSPTNETAQKSDAERTVQDYGPQQEPRARPPTAAVARLVSAHSRIRGRVPGRRPSQ